MDMYTIEVCEAIHKELNAVLEEIGGRHHTKLQAGPVRYGQTELSITVRGMLLSNPDIPPDQDLFNRVAPVYGIPADTYGKAITIGGKVYTVCGINPNARKNRIRLNANGKAYGCSPKTLKTALDAAIRNGRII